MKYDGINKQDSNAGQDCLDKFGLELILLPLGRMPQSEVLQIVLRKGVHANRLLANVFLSFRGDLFLDTVRQAELAGKEVDRIGFSVLADKFDTVLQLVLDVKRRIAHSGSLSALRRWCHGRLKDLHLVLSNVNRRIARGSSLFTIRRFFQAMLTRVKQSHVNTVTIECDMVMMYIRHFNIVQLGRSGIYN